MTTDEPPSKCEVCGGGLREEAQETEPEWDDWTQQWITHTTFYSVCPTCGAIYRHPDVIEM